MTGSLADELRALPEAEAKRKLRSLTVEEAEALQWDWNFWARPSQIPPKGDWTKFLYLAGRGAGKSRSGAEWVRANHHRFERIALVAPTARDARAVMVEGDSGLLSVFPRDDRPHYEPSKAQVRFKNGAVAEMYSGEEPDRLRGHQHHGAWVDELAAFKYAQDAWDQLQLGLRLGEHPQEFISTTPRPIKVIRDLMADEDTVVVREPTYANVQNLAPSFAKQIIRRYEGTLLGRQELMAEVLDEYPGAFWARAMFEDHRVRESEVKLEDMERVVVAVDPAVTAGENADQTGITTTAKGADGRYYVLASEGVRLSPHGWASRVLDAFDRWGADRIIAEVNNGGDMVEATMRHERPDLPIKVIHSSRGKTVRAEPVASLYEQGRVSHVGTLVALEDQCCTFPVAADLDDLVDSLVFGLTELSAGQDFDTSVFPDPNELASASVWANVGR